MSIELMAIGLVLGILVGLTGVGGGSILTPLLVFMGVPMENAIGTDFIYNIGAKLTGTISNWRWHLINWEWVLFFGIGGVPAAALGSVWATYVLREPASLIILRKLLGLALIFASAAILLEEGSKVLPFLRVSKVIVYRASRIPKCVLMGLGVVIGFMVGVTSVGAGALVAPILIKFSKLKLREIVGTDLAISLSMVTVAAVPHVLTGTINYWVATNLLLGSVVGIWIGGKLADTVSGRGLKALMSTLVMLTGIRLV